MRAELAKLRRTERFSLTVGLFVDHAKAVRIPLLIILFAVVMTFWVDQVWELFLLLLLHLFDLRFVVRHGGLELFLIFIFGCSQALIHPEIVFFELLHLRLPLLGKLSGI